MINVVLQGSDYLIGFDITLNADHTVLKPMDANVSGNMFSPGGFTIAKCIGGVLKQGVGCAATDTNDTIHLVMIAPLGFAVVPPATGLLFTAVYNVTSSISTTIGYQTGCPSSSVVGTTSCVQLVNGTTLPVPENIQTATYTQAPSPTFALTSDQPGYAVRRGSSTTAIIGVISVNGLSGQVSLSLSITHSVKHLPHLDLTPSKVALVSGGTSNSTLAISTNAKTNAGIYLITITGRSGTQSGSIQVQLYVVP
jgi:hypothetical protein